MNRRRTVLRNALVSTLQVVANAAILVVLYPFLIRSLGEEHFGVWALVVAWTAAGSLANMGLSGGALKFTSQYLARGDVGRVLTVVQTATLSVAGVLGIVLLLTYPAFALFLDLLFESPATADAAHAILPAAFLSFWLLSIAGVLISSIDGCHRMDVRSVLLVGTTLVYFIACLVAVPRFGLPGLVGAQVLQNLLLVLGAWLILRRLLPGLPHVPFRWRREVFREMLGYSMNFQAISFFMMLSEPVAKTLIAQFSGVSMVTPFEAAQKMVVQLRAVAITAYTAVVPAITELHETNPARIRDVYRQSYRVLLFIILLALPGLISATPLISRVWLGVYDGTFVLFAALLLTGWFLNMLTAPAYFANMGTGHLRWNVLSHATTGILTALLGGWLGWLYGGAGVVAGFVVALLVGSFLVPITYEREQGLSGWKLVGRENVVLGLAAGAGMVASLSLYYRFEADLTLPWMIALVTATFGVAIIVPLWKHPVRRYVHTWAIRTITTRFATLKPTATDA